METEQPKNILYGFFAIIGVLAPWVWFTGLICFALDKVIWYLAKGREREIREFLKADFIERDLRISKLETEIERLKK